MVRKGGHDMLCSFGNNKMVLLDGLTEGERHEDKNKMDIQVVPTIAEGESSNMSNTDPDVPFEPDAEDLATDQLLQQDPTANKYKAYLVIDGDTGGDTMKHKSSILQILSNNDPNSTDRLKRVMDLSRFDPSSRELAIGQSFDPQEPKVSIQDPAATLVRSKNLIWLAFVQIVDLRLNNAGMQSLPTRILGEPNVRVKVQIMSVSPVAQGCESEEGDWEWTGHFESLPRTTSTCEIEGHRLQLLDPAVLAPTRPGNKNMKTYRLLSSETVAVAKLMFKKLKDETDRFPKVPWGSTFSYCTWNGM
jgi:hypothetical protein